MSSRVEATFASFFRSGVTVCSRLVGTAAPAQHSPRQVLEHGVVMSAEPHLFPFRVSAGADRHNVVRVKLTGTLIRQQVSEGAGAL